MQVLVQAGNKPGSVPAIPAPAPIGGKYGVTNYFAATLSVYISGAIQANGMNQFACTKKKKERKEKERKKEKKRKKIKIKIHNLMLV